MELVRLGVDPTQAVAELFEICGERRVAVVRARQDLEARLQSEHDGPDTMAAIELIDGVIKLLPA